MPGVAEQFEEYPTGETVWVEQFTRTTHPSGRITDGQIRRVRPDSNTTLTKTLEDLAAMVTRERTTPGTTRTVLQRTVTVTAGDWAEAAVKPPPTRSRMSDLENQG